MASYVEVALHGSDLEIATLQRRGIPASGVDRIAHIFGVPKSRVLDVTGISTTTYQRHKNARTPLSTGASEALTRLFRLYGLAERILPEPRGWFQQALPVLGGETPFVVCGTEAGGRAVEEVLVRIDVGSVA